MASNSMTLYRTLNRADSQIRILNLLPYSVDPPSTENAIVCDLRVVSLKDRPQFKALSYVWGDPEDTVPIIVNDQPFKVTKNLASALRHLRDLKKSIPLWADAVCINQEDDGERNYQVSLMGEIYRAAEEVLGWVAESDTKALYLMKFWAKNKDLTGDEDLVKITETGAGHFLWGEEDWEAAQKFFGRQFWNRQWILQEIALARKIVILFDSRMRSSIDFSEVGRALENWQQIRNAKWDRYTKPFPHIHSISLDKPRIHTSLRDLVTANKQLPDCLTLLRLCRPMECSNPLDKLYALINLACDRNKIIPQYEKSVKDVYMDFARDVMSSTSGLNLLLDAGSFGLAASDRFNLPTWVPDWKDYGGRFDFPNTLFKAGIRKAAYKSGIALGLGGCIITQGDQPCLRTTGVILGQVSEATSAKVMYEDPGKVIGIPFVVYDLHRCYPNGIPMLQAYFRTMLLDYDTQTGERLSPHAGSFFDLAAGFLFMLLLIHMVKEPDQSLHTLITKNTIKRNHPLPCPDYVDFYLKWQGKKSLDNQFVEDTLEPFLGWSGSGIPSILWPKETDMERGAKCVNVFYNEMTRRMKDRCFFKMNNDYFGIGPRATALGDVVCVLWGCNMPLVLRKNEDNYEIVGPCFVHGLMDGEAEKLVVDGEKKEQTLFLS